MECHEVWHTFLFLQSFWDRQDKFQAWMVSSDWKNNDWRDEEDHKFTYDCLIDRIWWEKVEMVLKTVTPLYSVLRFADQQKNGTISGSESRPILDEYDDDNDDWDAPGSFLIEELQMSKSDVVAFKRNLGFDKNSIGKKPMSQLDEEEEFEDDYESESPHGSPLYDEPWDICSDDEGGGSGSRGGALGASASAPTRAVPSLPQSTHIRPRSTRKRKPTHKSVYDL
ncbi:hypothetical protein Zm00014a_025252 [Zea mays]|uniref:Uncharacterized protein n=1 Tax=Zea mays TaxID=4577 RepID=A0A3L6DNH8_MAIZE|nr:hypothetical protein Zm00014a_025252 [Zea mays]